MAALGGGGSGGGKQRRRRLPPPPPKTGGGGGGRRQGGGARAASAARRRLQASAKKAAAKAIKQKKRSWWSVVLGRRGEIAKSGDEGNKEADEDGEAAKECCSCAQEIAPRPKPKKAWYERGPVQLPPDPRVCENCRQPCCYSCLTGAALTPAAAAALPPAAPKAIAAAPPPKKKGKANKKKGAAAEEDGDDGPKLPVLRVCTKCSLYPKFVAATELDDQPDPRYAICVSHVNAELSAARQTFICRKTLFSDRTRCILHSYGPGPHPR